MPITFYNLAGSPYAWRVHLALEHKQADYVSRAVAAGKGEHKSDAYRAMNPRGKIPVLVDGDVTLFESAAILEYLEDHLADNPRLFPAGKGERARARRVVCEIDQYLAPQAVRLSGNFYFKKPEYWDHDAIAEARAAVSDELAYFEDEVIGDGLAGPLGAADFAIYPFLAHLTRYELRKPDLGLTSEIGPNLRGLMGRIEALPFFDATYPAHWRS